MQHVTLKTFMFLSMSSLFFVGCLSEKTDAPDLHPVAQVGERTIAVGHLKRSFALSPKWGAGLTRRQAHQHQLDYLIDQKLFAQESIRQNLHLEPTLAGYLEFLEQKELIKALYRHEIAAHVEISEEEYQRAYLDSKKQVRFQYLYAPNNERALAFRRYLETEPFDSIQVDAGAGERKGVTTSMSFGDMVAELEAVVFDMEIEEISAPIPVQDGFMVIKLIEGVEDKFLSEMDFAEHKNRLQKVLYDRKAGPIANRYIKELMLDKNLTLNREVFYHLSHLFDDLTREMSDDPTLIPVHLSDQDMQLVQDRTADFQKETLATFSGGVITVEEFLQTLSNMPAGFRPRVKSAPALKDAIGVIVRNRFLAARARQKGLGQLSEVRSAIQIQQDEVLAEYYLSRHRKTVEITPEDISDFQQRMSDVPMTGEINADEIEQIILEYRMAEFKLAERTRLSRVFEIAVDSVSLESAIANPDEIIDRDPIPFVMQEQFN